MRTKLLTVGFAVGSLIFLGSGSPWAQTGSFLETFNGSPVVPQPWRPTNWDVTVHSRDRDTFAQLEPMAAHHGADCSPHPATHQTSAYEDAVFLCRDHVMTAISASGYGMIYLTPNQIVDFSQGQAVVSWDMTTLRQSGRDWVDLWVTPYEDNMQLALQEWLPDVAGPPRNALHVVMGFYRNQTEFRVELFRDFQHVGESSTYRIYESVLTQSATRRDRFELRLGGSRLWFGMPQYGLVWVDQPMPALGWTSGIVSFGHHSYTPTKDAGGLPNTWHWDNISISPARPFTIIRADKRTVNWDADPAATVTFPSPAPASSHLRFAGIGDRIDVSFDGGTTWTQAQLRQTVRPKGAEHYGSYWTPIPVGTQQVMFRGQNWWGDRWDARDITIWSQTTGGSLPTTTTTAASTTTSTTTAASTTTTAASTTTTTVPPTTTPWWCVWFPWACR